MINCPELVATIVLNPRDSLAKQVYADWLEERGENCRARAYRWAAENNKHPFYNVENRWHWYCVQAKDEENHPSYLSHLLYCVLQVNLGLRTHYNNIDSSFNSLGKALDFLNCVSMKG